MVSHGHFSSSSQSEFPIRPISGSMYAVQSLAAEQVSTMECNRCFVAEAASNMYTSRFGLCTKQIEECHIACGPPCGWCSEYAGGGRSGTAPGTGGSVGPRSSVAHSVLLSLLGVLAGAALAIVLVSVFETPTLLVPIACASLLFASQAASPLCVAVRYRAFVFCLPRAVPDISPDHDPDAFDPSVQGVFARCGCVDIAVAQGWAR